MSDMTWLLAYLLSGFVLDWIATHYFGAKPNVPGWKWELASVLVWPVTLIVVIWQIWHITKSEKSA